LLLEAICNLLEGITLSPVRLYAHHQKIGFGAIAAIAADLRQYVEGASGACRQKAKPSHLYDAAARACVVSVMAGTPASRTLRPSAIVG
jgi:hypothetical protein